MVWTWVGLANANEGHVVSRGLIVVLTGGTGDLGSGCWYGACGSPDHIEE